MCQIPVSEHGQHIQSPSLPAGQQTSPNLAKANVNVTIAGQSYSKWSPVSCPKGHLTHNFLACDVSTSCWARSDVTFSFSPDTWAFPTSLSCPVQPAKMSPAPYFPCKSEEQRVPYSLVCDHRRDCADESDETFCKFFPCNLQSQFECRSKQVCFVRVICYANILV